MSVNLRTIYAFAREMYPKRVAEDISYGTAGFRGNAQNLDYVMYRMGLLATLRSRYKNGQVIGVMITASHNPEADNGVKLIDPMGEMLESKWETIATDLVRVTDSELEKHVTELIKNESIDIGTHSTVFVGMDNRYHSPGLLKAVKDGVIALKGNVKEFGIVSTPMMHFFVVSANSKSVYGTPTEDGYYSKLITAFESLRGKQLEYGNYKNTLIFDGANGVGGCKMFKFLKRMNNSLNVQIINNGSGKINENCGADYVKVQQKAPIGMPVIPKNTRCCSVDGDADRVVYFFTDNNEKFQLLDGDRIATLVAGFLMESINSCGLNDLKIGLVQTAYANGASTEYIINKLKIPVSCVSTGVKHLHHEALNYDIGVYFEANGHGTVIFSNNAKKSIENTVQLTDDKKVKEAEKLLKVIDMINETVGDAISDILLVETILNKNGWEISDWLNTYTDLPNLQLKIKVQDRAVITTTDAERTCITPEGLQDEINKIVAKYNKGRAFIRPSGTEDVVRVYAEAENKEDVETLAYDISGMVYKLAGGVGPEPVKPEFKMNSHI